MVLIYILQKRLDNMLYVGLTEEHKESATIFANVVGKQVLSQLQALSSSFGRTANNKTGKRLGLGFKLLFLTSQICCYGAELSSSFPDSKTAKTFG